MNNTVRFIRKDDMIPEYAKYFKKDAKEIVKQIYLTILELHTIDHIDRVALECSSKLRHLGWTDKERHITLTPMPHNAKHLITLQEFLLWVMKQKDVKDKT